MVLAAKAEAALTSRLVSEWYIAGGEVARMHLQNKIRINNIVESLQKDAEQTEPSQEPG
jgi:hypothetical protein